MNESQNDPDDHHQQDDAAGPEVAGHKRRGSQNEEQQHAGADQRFTEQQDARVTGEALVGTILALVGLPGLAPLPWEQMRAIFGYAMVSCLVVNDGLKVAMIKWFVPTASARPPAA